MISDDKLDELQRICDEATPGPWYRCHHEICTIDSMGDYRNCDGGNDCEEKRVRSMKECNKALLMAARIYLPDLIAEVRRYKLLQNLFNEYQIQFKQQIDALVQTRREADWLASQLGEGITCAHTQDIFKECPATNDKSLCAKCWREKAQKEMRHD